MGGIKGRGRDRRRSHNRRTAAQPKLMAPAETQSPDTAQVETKVLMGAVANSTSVNLDLVA